MTQDQTAAEPEYGWFKIYQNGAEVAGGSGPWPAIKSEAQHYAVMYSQDGPVKVRVQRTGRRRKTDNG